MLLPCITTTTNDTTTAATMMLMLMIATQALLTKFIFLPKLTVTVSTFLISGPTLRLTPLSLLSGVLRKRMIPLSCSGSFVLIE